jgi:hypothetical protein
MLRFRRRRRSTIALLSPPALARWAWDGSGPLEPLASFMTNPAGAQIVNAVGRSAKSSRAAPKRRDGTW